MRWISNRTPLHNRLRARTRGGALAGSLFLAGMLLGATQAGCPPTEPPPPRHPTTLPPQRPSTAPRCEAGLYLRGGRWVYAKGAWSWEKPRCVPRPADWHDGCVWEQGQWQRTEGRIHFLPGKLVCRARSAAPKGEAPTPPPTRTPPRGDPGPATPPPAPAR